MICCLRTDRAQGPTLLDYLHGARHHHPQGQCYLGTPSCYSWWLYHPWRLLRQHWQVQEPSQEWEQGWYALAFVLQPMDRHHHHVARPSAATEGRQAASSGAGWRLRFLSAAACLDGCYCPLRSSPALPAALHAAGTGPTAAAAAPAASAAPATAAATSSANAAAAGTADAKRRLLESLGCLVGPAGTRQLLQHHDPPAAAIHL